MNSTWQIIEGDCLDVLRGMPENSVDLVVADPPYGQTSLAWDVRVPNWMDLLQMILKPHGSVWVFGSLKSFVASGVPPNWKLAQDIIWEKHNGSSFHDDRFRRVHEQAVQFYWASWAAVYKDPRYTFDATKRKVNRQDQPPHMGKIGASDYATEDGGPRLMRSVIRVRSMNGRAEHPTQKPTGILTPLIEYSCPPGGTVLDPFAGSGSTLAAAVEIGRNAIGIEVDPEYAAIARARLTDSLFNVAAAMPDNASPTTEEAA